MFRWTVLIVFLASLFVTGCSSSTPEPKQVDPTTFEKARTKNIKAIDD